MFEALLIFLPPLVAGIIAVVRRPDPTRLLLAITFGWAVSVGLHSGLTAFHFWMQQQGQATPSAVLPESSDGKIAIMAAKDMAAISLFFAVVTGIVWLQTRAGKMLWPRLTMGLIWLLNIGLVIVRAVPKLIEQPTGFQDFLRWSSLVSRLTNIVLVLAAAALAALLGLLIASMLRRAVHDR